MPIPLRAGTPKAAGKGLLPRGVLAPLDPADIEPVVLSKGPGHAAGASDSGSPVRPNAGSADDCADAGSGVTPASSSDVWVHIYHCDPYTGFLNRVALNRAEIGIFHAGVEVYGEEWSFQYFEDTWNDPSISGLIRCMPKNMSDYEYQESVNLGPTTCSEDEVDHLLLSLHYEWPACSYHLTHRNCLVFAEHLVSQLRPPKPFPAQLKGILEASTRSASVDAVVDYSWSWVKWWMMRKHQQEEELMVERRALEAGSGEVQSRAGLWSVLFPFDSMCSGSLCPGAPRRGDNGSTIEESRCTTVTRAAEAPAAAPSS